MTSWVDWFRASSTTGHVVDFDSQLLVTYDTSVPRWINKNMLEVRWPNYRQTREKIWQAYPGTEFVGESIVHDFPLVCHLHGREAQDFETRFNEHYADKSIEPWSAIEPRTILKASTRGAFNVLAMSLVKKADGSEKMIVNRVREFADVGADSKTHRDKEPRVSIEVTDSQAVADAIAKLKLRFNQDCFQVTDNRLQRHEARDPTDPDGPGVRTDPGSINPQHVPLTYTILMIGTPAELFVEAYNDIKRSSGGPPPEGSPLSR